MIHVILLLLASIASAQSPGPIDNTIAIDQFQDCGLITRFSPAKIKPECFQSINNAVLDADYSILRRNGYSAYNATPCTGSKAIRGSWPFYGTSGAQYLVVLSSNSMFYSQQDGTCTAIAGLSGLSATAQMSCIQSLGYLWCTNGEDTVFKTNIVSTASIPTAPLGKYIGAFRNRILLGGVNGSLTNLYLSGELDGTDWTIPVVTYSTSPAIIRINGTNDGLAISCLMGEFQNNFYVGRNYDLYALSGYDLRDFVVRKVSDQVGCMENNSVQEVNNVLNWLSHRGVEGLSGTQINWLSYPIDPTIKTIITAAGNSQGFTVNGNNFTQGNLTASGTGAPISASIVPGTLVPSTASFVDNFSSGTQYVNISTVDIVGAIQLSSASYTDAWATTVAGRLAWTLGTASSYAAETPGITSDGGIGGQPIAGAGNVLYTSSVTFSSGSWTFSHYVSASGSPQCSPFNGPPNRCFEFRFQKSGTSYYAAFLNDSSYPTRQVGLMKYNGATTTVLSQSTYTYSNGPTYTWQVIKQASAGAMFLYINGVFVSSAADTSISSSGRTEIGAWAQTDSVVVRNHFRNFNAFQYQNPGRYVSREYDTSFSTPTWGPLSSTFTVLQNSDGQVVFYTHVSSSPNNDLYTSYVASSDTVKIASAQKRYIQYEALLTTYYSTQTPKIYATSLTAATTGYYISPCVTIPAITSWSNFNVDAVTNGGAFTFWISTGASCGQVTVTTATWNLQTANSIISVPTAPFVAARVLFYVDTATQTPILSDFSFNWNAGTSRPPVVSANYLNRYWMFYTTATATGATNDHAVVYDQNGHWILGDDIYAGSAALYLNSLYLGDSRDTGTIYLFDTGQTDSGNPFNFSFTTPDLDGGDPISPKQFSRAYLTIGAPEATTQGSSLDCEYAIDGSTTTYALGTVDLSEAPEQGGYFVAKFPFPSSQPTTGHWINLSCSNYGSAGPLRVYNIRIVYTKTEWP